MCQIIVEGGRECLTVVAAPSRWEEQMTRQRILQLIKSIPRLSMDGQELKRNRVYNKFSLSCSIKSFSCAKLLYPGKSY